MLPRTPASRDPHPENTATGTTGTTGSTGAGNEHESAVGNDHNTVENPNANGEQTRAIELAGESAGESPVSSESSVIDHGVGVPDRLTRLWAPYRMSYIADSPKPKTGAGEPTGAPSGEVGGAHEADAAERVTGAGASEASAKQDEAPVDADPFLAVPKLADEDGLIVARGEHVFCVLNLYPYNAGHMMVIPYRKERNLEDLTPEESAELMSFAQAAIRTLKAVSNPDGINAGFNLGRASGGSVADHLHLHVVPRWVGDSNFMTIIDGTKVLPQVLKETRALFAAHWRDDPHCPGVARA